MGTATTDFGEALVDAGGMSLYGFLNDTGGISACYDACAETWPPVLVDGSDLPAGLDAAVFSVSERTDGTHQLVAGDWPLYLYAPDTAPGDTAGGNGDGNHSVFRCITGLGCYRYGSDANPHPTVAVDARIEPTVIGAFMELAEPSIGDAVRRAADGGATVVAVLPYFLHPGRHQQKDIPELVAEAADSRPGIEVRVVEHFGSDPAVVDLLAAQVARALAP